MIITFQDAHDVNFGQASIYVDACFILSYMDSNDERGDKVSFLLDMWKKQKIEKV